MRKSASIILLVILLFNMVGYRAWFYYAEKRADAAMEGRLNTERYNENDLISITIPLDNPYQLEQKSFQRIDGEISIQGKTFKYVKRKVSNGNLILLCIPDTRKMVLNKAKTDYGNAANDLAGNNKNSSRSGSQKNLSGGDYLFQCADVQICKWANAVPTRHIFNLGKYANACIPLPGKPPQTTIA